MSIFGTLGVVTLVVLIYFETLECFKLIDGRLTKEQISFIPRRSIRQVTTVRECGSNATVTSDGGKISSPNYPNSYYGNLECQWHLTAGRQYISLRINELLIEDFSNCSTDYLDIYANLTEDGHFFRRICGKKYNEEFTIKSSRVLLVFKSDDTVEEKGFEIEYHLAQNPNAKCDHYLNDSKGKVTSPGYPENYPMNSDCFTLITVEETKIIYLTLEVLKLEYDKRCGNDYVTIYDGPNEESPLIGKFCSNETPLALKSTKNTVLIHFHSDDTISDQGFELKYTTEGVSSKIGACGWIQNQKGGIIMSPLYPKQDYPSNSRCTIDIKGPDYHFVQFTFDDFILELDNNCAYDMVIIQDGFDRNDEKTIGVYCGTDVPSDPVLSTTNNVLFTFISDDTTERSGFKISYKFMEDPDIVKPGSWGKIGDICGLPKQKRHEIRTRIVGGNEAKKGAYPWQVMFWVPKLFAFCGGVLLNERWFVTAAHCLTSQESTDIKWNEIMVRLGKLYQSVTEPEEFSTGIKDVELHPNFDQETLDNDIALVRLNEAVHFTDYIQPVCLGDPKFIEDAFFAKENQMGTVTGWGRLAESGAKPKILKELQLPIVKRTVCQTSNSKMVTRNMFCAGYKDSVGDSCQGDSGGPFVTQKDGRWYLAGLVSFGEGCGQDGKYGVYTKINNYHSWIRKIIIDP